MKNTGFIALVLVSGMTVGAGAAFAKPGFGLGPSFGDLDADGNGEVTRQEIEAMAERRFTEADTDGDGALTLDEMQAHARKKADERAARMLDRLDTNGDSRLTSDELPEPRRSGQMFERLDTDDSGGISREEFAEARERMMDHRRKGHGKMKRHGGQKPDNN